MLTKDKAPHLKRLRMLRDTIRQRAKDSQGLDRRNLNDDARAVDVAISAITHSGVLSTPWRDYALHLEQCRACHIEQCPYCLEGEYDACDVGAQLKFLAETTL